MKLALSNIAWDPAEDAAVAELLREFGVSALEAAPTKAFAAPLAAKDEEIQAYRKRWEETGFAIVALQALLFGQADLSIFGPERARTLDYLAGIARVGGMLGAGPMVFGSPKNRRRGEMPYDEAFALAREFFREAAERCAGTGAMLALEPNPATYGCDFIQTADEALAMVEAVDHPLFGLHLDSGILHLNGEDAGEVVPRCAARMVHFHVSEPQLAVIGTGGVDHARVAEALRAADYAGYVSVEMRNGWTTPDADAVRQALEYTVKVYG